MMREKLEELAKDWAADKDGMMSYAYAAHELRAILAAEPDTGMRALMDRVAEEHPIAGDYEDDARHNWPERWFALWELSVASPPQKPPSEPKEFPADAEKQLPLFT